MFFLKKKIDSRGLNLYRAAPFALAVLFLVAPAREAFSQLMVGNVMLPSGCRPIGKNRYKAPGRYLDTLKFFEKQYAAHPWQTIVTQPGIRGVHIANKTGEGDWAGLNIYEVGNETRIYIVPKDSERSSPRGR